MRVLLFVDGSSYSDTAIKTLEALGLPNRTEVIIMTVIPEHAFLGGVTLGKLRGAVIEKKKEQQEAAFKLLQGPVQLISSYGLKVESLVQWGNPAQEILRVAEESDALLIVMGAKGMTDTSAYRLGSISQAVVKHARASVLIARNKTVRVDQGLQPEQTAITAGRVLFATDGSQYADMAARFLLDLPLPQQSQVTVVTVLQSYFEALLRTPTLDFQTNQELLANLQASEESEARKIVAKNSQQFEAKGYTTNYLILKGAAGESILKAADEYDPDIIALGARGLTGIESFFLGSVSERIVRHARCSVLIVKPQKK